MRFFFILLVAGSCLALLAGCWDQELLKDVRIVYMSGFDYASNGKLKTTFVLRDVTGSNAETKEGNEIHTVIGSTPRKMGELLNMEVGGDYSPSKTRVILLGEKIAKHDIYPMLDIFYRDPKSALNAKIAVVQGTAKDLIDIKKTGDQLIEEHIEKMMDSMEIATIIPKGTIQTLCAIMLDPGEDFAMAYIINKNNKPAVDGLALFHNKHMTGKLGKEEALLYLLMSNKKRKKARITVKVHEEKKQNVSNYITIDVQKLKRKMKVSVEDKQIKVDLDLKLTVNALEYPEDHLNQKKVRDQLNKKISKELTKKSKEIIRKIQKSKHDGFGIGRHLKAFYPELWKEIQFEWPEHYAEMQFNPSVTVDIVNHGIIN